MKRVLRLGIVLLGLRLSIAEVGSIGLKALPIVLVTIPAAILLVGYLGRRIQLSDRLASLIAIGTSICGNTAIVAVSPTIGAKEEETSYAVACITVFGLFAMLVYPFVAHWIFGGDPFAAGLFLGSAVHDTSQVAGAAMVYQEYYHAPEALDVATVTKLLRNLSMLVVIPLMAIRYHRKASSGATPPPWWTMVPLFVIGFAAMSLLRTIGDLSERPFGLLDPDQWHAFINVAKAGRQLLPRHRNGRRRPRHQHQGAAQHRAQATDARVGVRVAGGPDQRVADQAVLLSGAGKAQVPVRPYWGALP